MSITSAVGKILESIIRDIIVAYINDYSLYSDCQHGFRKHRSCVTQLLHVVEDLSDMFDNSDPFDIIYLDFKKRLIRSHIIGIYIYMAHILAVKIRILWYNQ